MIAAHLKVDSGKFYIVLSHNFQGKRITPTFCTGYPVSKNRRKAQAMMNIVATEYVAYDTKEELVHEKKRIKKIIKRIQMEGVESYNSWRNDIDGSRLGAIDGTTIFADTLLADYLELWLTKVHRLEVKESTYARMCSEFYHGWIPFFMKRKTTVSNVNESDIQAAIKFIKTEWNPNRVLNSRSMRLFLGELKQALLYGYRNKIIPIFLDFSVKLPNTPSQKKYKYLSADEMNLLLSKTKKRVYFPLLWFLCVYGLRIGEALGLQFKDFDMKNRTFVVRRQYLTMYDHEEGHRRFVVSETLKTESSYRVLPFVNETEEVLHQIRELKEKYAKQHKMQYDHSFDDFLMTNTIGHIIERTTFSRIIQETLTKNHMPVIRIHDLRHSNATLLYQKGVPLKHIQYWLGHKDMSTTMNIYAHVRKDYQDDIVQMLQEELCK